MLFGERLPEVARSFGKQFMDLQNGVRGIQRRDRKRRNLGDLGRSGSRDVLRRKRPKKRRPRSLSHPQPLEVRRPFR